MTHSVQLIRLLAAVVIACAACSFVACYDSLAYIRYPFDHPNADGHREPPGQAFGGFVWAAVCPLGIALRATAMRPPLVGALACLMDSFFCSFVSA